jgi:hypothetical protein
MFKLLWFSNLAIAALEPVIQEESFFGADVDSSAQKDSS